MFCFVMGPDLRIDNGTRLLMKLFKDCFGDIEKNMCVIFTRWGDDTKSIKNRKKQGVTEESRTKDVREQVLTSCGFKNTERIPIFFTDVFEIEEGNTGKTAEVLYQ